MDTSKNLILNNGKDVTSDVTFCKYDPQLQKWNVSFNSGKTYYYNYQSIIWIRDPRIMDPSLVHIKHGDQDLFNIQAIYIFNAPGTSYWRIRFSNSSERLYDVRELKIATSCLSDTAAHSCYEYMKRIAAINELHTDDGTVLLSKQYEKIDFIGNDTALAVYFGTKLNSVAAYQYKTPIFPFGINGSQYYAVKAALSNQISVIQGPPGTGKTQTILNIIANLLVQGKTLQVVSNNNSALDNIIEKLSSPEYDLKFLVAFLGSSKNKLEFINNQSSIYPNLSKWYLDGNAQTALLAELNVCTAELSEIFKKQQRLAKAKQELDALLLEKKYYEQYCRETGISEQQFKIKPSLSSERVMQFWQECFEFSENERPLSFWYKIKSAIIYGIAGWRFFRNDISVIIAYMQSLFYHTKQKELSKEIAFLDHDLKVADVKSKMDVLASGSLKYLRGKLYQKYCGRSCRKQFDESDLWKNPNRVADEYPIVLSTTFSSRSSLGKNMMYDYIIMDEASQVDVATGALALSCARNAVIVGDTQQLPNILSDDMKKRADAAMASFKINTGYSFTENSFLQSVCRILPGIPKTMLREHYRCHPKIIGFCNQKFYNNELIIMTEDHNEPDVLSVYKTVVGNHRRDNMNQRQIDVVCSEAIPKLLESGTVIEKAGIIAPYNDQVNALKDQLSASCADIATVHKFQGREKDAIILTTVDDVVTDFTDNPFLLNVAVSRAKKRLCLVVSGNEQPIGSNIGDLISYIEYNNFEVVESEIYSVFDYLYKQYTEARVAFLKKRKRVSEYDSENLMYSVIKDIIRKNPNSAMDVVIHQPLNMLIRDPKLLNEEECRYAMNPATHLDFLIYSRISKKPVLAIEVDGFSNHKKGTRQEQRDRLKDHILELYGIHLLRLPTNGSGERQKIEQALQAEEKSVK